MALPGPRSTTAPLGPMSAPAAPDDAALADAVEVYRRTYMTVLRSSGETRLRVLEASHKAMHSSLHGLADSPSSTSAPSSTRCAAFPTRSSRPRSW